MAQLNMKKTVGLVLCLGAVAVAVSGWTWAHSSSRSSTDNAYIRGDMTSLAPKVAGYVMSVEVEDNQTVRAGDVLFRIDDRDYRAQLAQAQADVKAAQARLADVDAETQLQHALIRQAEARTPLGPGRDESGDQGLRPRPEALSQQRRGAGGGR